MSSPPHDAHGHDPLQHHAGGVWEKTKLTVRVILIVVAVGAGAAALTIILDYLGEQLQQEAFGIFVKGAKIVCYSGLFLIVFMDAVADVVQASRREVILLGTHAHGVRDVVLVAFAETIFISGFATAMYGTVLVIRLLGLIPAQGAVGIFIDGTLALLYATLWCVIVFGMCGDVADSWKRVLCRI